MFAEALTPLLERVEVEQFFGRVDFAGTSARRIRLVPVMRDADNQVVPLAPGSENGARIVYRLRALSGDGIALEPDAADLTLHDPAKARPESARPPAPAHS